MVSGNPIVIGNHLVIGNGLVSGIRFSLNFRCCAQNKIVFNSKTKFLVKFKLKKLFTIVFQHFWRQILGRTAKCFRC